MNGRQLFRLSFHPYVVVGVFWAHESLDGLEQGFSDEQAAGVSIIRRAVEEPRRRISETPGSRDRSWWTR